MAEFRERYGPVALVTGAGLGEAFRFPRNMPASG